MNVFFINRNPEQAAAELCLQHRAKMLTESVQILCTAVAANYPQTAEQFHLWKPAYQKHPAVIWAAENQPARMWILDHAIKLSNLHSGKEPAAANAQLYKLRAIIRNEQQFDYFTQPPQCMDFEYKVPGDTVLAYQRWYASKAVLWATYAKPWLKMRYSDPSAVPAWLSIALGPNSERFFHFTESSGDN